MGNRISKVYTRTGDKGDTGLGDGSRVSKASNRIEVIGDVDELNSMLSCLLAQDYMAEFREGIGPVQHLLFDLGGELSLPGTTTLNEKAIARVEALIDELNGTLPPLKDFVLPGGNRQASVCHFTRAVCRRCERHIVSLAETEFVNPISIIVLNRLSDLLFVLARTLARRNGGEEILWNQELFR